MPLALAGVLLQDGGRASDGASQPLLLGTMQAITISTKLAAVFGGSLLALFAASLAVEDQRHFVACRATGASADACLLQISGR